MHVIFLVEKFMNEAGGDGICLRPRNYLIAKLVPSTECHVKCQVYVITVC